MAENMMGGMGKSALYEDEAKPAAPAKGDQETKSEDEGESVSTVIPKTALPTGTKVGDTISFRVTEDYGDEFGVEPSSEDESSSNSSMMDMSKSDIAAMDEAD